jgi:hypothetical protein
MRLNQLHITQGDEMARTKTNKSAKIRELLIATPDRSAVEIANEVGAKPGLVYNIKATMKKKAGTAKAKPGRKPGKKSGKKPVAKAATPQGAHAALDSAFEFVVKVGGLLHAEQLIAKLKSIKERL